MQACSAVYQATIARNHRMLVTLDVQTPQGDVLASGIQVDSGNVQVDATATIRRTCTLSIVDRDGTLDPILNTDVLAPFGNEIVISRGVVLPDGTAEMKQLGVFLFQRVDTADDQSGKLGTIVISGFDRAKRVSRAGFINGYLIAAGTNGAEAVRTLIDLGVPGLTYDFATITAVTPLVVYTNSDDRWSKAVELAASFGQELFFDAFGVCVMRPVPDPNTKSVVWTYQDVDGGMLTDATRSWTTEETYSSVRAESSNTSTTTDVAVATVYDTDPNSPTYYLGKYGLVTKGYSSPLLTDVNSCINAATALLRQSTGSYQSINFGAIVNPAHEAGDIVQIVNSRTGVNSTYVLDVFTVPLDPETAMTAATRKRSV